MDDKWESVICQPYPDSKTLNIEFMLFRVRVTHNSFVFLVNSKTLSPRFFDNFVKEYENCIFYNCSIGGAII